MNLLKTVSKRGSLCHCYAHVHLVSKFVGSGNSHKHPVQGG